jgi:hypothetical protein
MPPRLFCAMLFASQLATGALAQPLGDNKAAALTERRKEIQALAPAGFTVLIQPPFVVVGDEPAAKVRQRAEGSISWAVDRLKRDFFQKDPDEVITIWLFKDRSSYETNSRRLFRGEHLSPFGYYSPVDRALIMNIGTGGGTLIHEIVHPYMRANFPTCPAWFNEGLGSLFEQCEDRDGRIHGLPNWRLPGLQKVIGEGRTIPFADFVTLSDGAFYGGSTGYNQHYGQARYLCYFLQEHGLLVKFYREFVDHRHDDPTGLLALKKVLGTDDLVEFQGQWEKFVLALRFP